nr:immunoglobulin light chain junction region [Macaca mulatta]
CLQGYYTPLTF